MIIDEEYNSDKPEQSKAFSRKDAKVAKDVKNKKV
jgi:hypothetical protein